MRNTYTNEIAELHKWVENADYQLGTGFPFLHTEAEVHIVCQRICFIASYIQEEYPFYSSQLPIISQRLFSGNPINGFTLNWAIFGELYIITQQLFSEPINIQCWTNIHPKIVQVSKDIFCDGHFDSAAEKAIKELETRLRDLFQQLKPSAGIPTKVGDILAHYWATMVFSTFVTHQRSAERISGGASNHCLMVCLPHIEIPQHMRIFHVQSMKLLSKLCLPAS